MSGSISVQRALWVALIALPLLSAARTGTGALRVYVSGLGNDSNAATDCPRANPCRTLATADTVVQAGGEIIALDPADYGPVTIAEQLSILGVAGAEIGVATGGTGITINAPAADRIIVRNFIISGAGAANTKGIQLNTGQLTLLKSTLKNLSTGLEVSNTKADLVDTDVISNTVGISTTGTGVDINATSIKGPTQVRVAWGSAIGNTTAYVMNNPGTGTGGANKVTILEFLTSNTSAAFSTNMTGNGTLVSGTGASCGGANCQNLFYYSANTNPD
jgi:hypothetical protein